MSRPARTYAGCRVVGCPQSPCRVMISGCLTMSLFAGSGLVADRQSTTDRSVIELCRSAFEAVWELSIPNSEYRPSQPVRRLASGSERSVRMRLSPGGS